MSKKIYFDENKNLYVEIIYYKTNSCNIKSIFYYLDSNRTIYHNNSGPAIITYNTNGYLLSEEFYINGKFNNPFSTHDNILPSRIWYHTYNNNNLIPYKEYYYINNILNNINTFNIDGKCIESLYNINSNYVNSIFYKNIKPYITKTEKYLLNNNNNSNNNSNNINSNNNISNNNNSNINNIINKIFSGELLKEDIEESNRLSTITDFTKSKKIKIHFKNKNFQNKNLKSINLI